MRYALVSARGEQIAAYLPTTTKSSGASTATP
jgi:hypothetical protein